MAGRFIRGAPGGATVGTSSTSLLVANEKRGGISFYNPNTYAVWLAAEDAALSSKGAWLSPGGSLDEDDPDKARLAWNGIAAASNAVTWIEWLEP